jgi:hypothetical protein
VLAFVLEDEEVDCEEQGDQYGKRQVQGGCADGFEHVVFWR